MAGKSLSLRKRRTITVTLDLNPELEQGPLARERGVALDAYLQDIVSRQVRNAAPPLSANANTLNLPARHLGDMGSLHRRDIYDDAR